MTEASVKTASDLDATVVAGFAMRLEAYRRTFPSAERSEAWWISSDRGHGVRAAPGHRLGICIGRTHSIAAHCCPAGQRQNERFPGWNVVQAALAWVHQAREVRAVPTMKMYEHKDLGDADEVRPFEKGRLSSSTSTAERSAGWCSSRAGAGPNM